MSMRKYLLLPLILAVPMANAHETHGHDGAPQSASTGAGDRYKSTQDAPYEYVDIEGGGNYGYVRMSFDHADAVGMVGKYKSSKGVQFTRHTHTDWVVLTVISGKVEVSRDEGADVRVYYPGDTYLVEPGETHVETSLEDTVVVVVNGPGVNNEKFTMRTVTAGTAGD